jgi:hypothetical protein
MSKQNNSARLQRALLGSRALSASFRVKTSLLTCAAIFAASGCGRQSSTSTSESVDVKVSGSADVSFSEKFSDEADVIRARNELEKLKLDFEREKLREENRKNTAIELERIQLQREQLEAEREAEKQEKEARLSNSAAIELERIKFQREKFEAEKLEVEEQQRRQKELDRLHATEVEVAAAKRQIGLWASNVLKNADRKRTEKKELQAFIAQCDETESALLKALSTSRIAETNINKNVVGSKTLVFTNIIMRTVTGEVQYKMLNDAITKAPPELTPKLAVAMDALRQATRELDQSTAMESRLARANTDAVSSYENRWNAANNDMLAAQAAAGKLQKRLIELDAEYKQAQNDRNSNRNITRIREPRELSEIRQDISNVKAAIETEQYKAKAAENRLGDIRSATAAHRTNTARDSFNSQRLTENTIQDNMRHMRTYVLSILVEAKSEKRAKIAVIDSELEMAADLKESFSKLNPEQILRIRDKISTQTEHRIINAIGD